MNNMQKNATNNINKQDNNDMSKQVENSLELLILYRSIYIIKQKFSLFKERIKNIYQQYNIYKNNIKLKTNIKIYQINIKNFVKVTDEVLQDLNLLLIKYLNPKDIFLSKILIEKKREETRKIIKEILIWLLNDNNGNNLIRNYNLNFYNKKIKPYIEEEIDYENFENLNKSNENDINEDFLRNFSKYEYKILTEYNRRGNKINKYKSRLLEENGEIDEEGITEIIDLQKENKEKKGIEGENDKVTLNKEMSVNINNLSNSKNNSKKTFFIFIESLPLILADFLQSHINNAIVESEDELGKELKILFDNEILKRLNEYKNILKDKSILEDIDEKVYINHEEKNQKELDNALEEYKKIKENIDIYRNILQNKKKIGENTDYIEKMIEKLLAKEVWLEHRIKLLMDKKYNNEINIESNFDNYKYNNNNNNNYKNNNLKSGDSTSAIQNTSRIIEINDNMLSQSKINGNINNQNNTNNSRQLSESIANTLNLGTLNGKSLTLKSDMTNLNSTKTNPSINNALKEIFLYYSTLHINTQRTRLFSTLEEKKLHLDLNEFSKFCTDFNIPIMRQKLVEIFKKTVADLHYMNFKEFNNAIISLANATHEAKKKKLTEKISHKKFELNSIIMKEKEMKEEKKLQRLLYDQNNDDIKLYMGENKKVKSKSPSGYAYKINLKLEKKNIFNDISNNKINYNKEKTKSYEEIVNDFYEFLCLNDQQKYRSKMRQYNMSPIKIRENYGNLSTKKFRNQSVSSNDKSIDKSKSFFHESLEKINIKKEEKLRKELMVKENMKNKLYKEKMKLFNINNQRLKITVDRKSKKKTYRELMKEQQEEKTEIISMHNYQKNRLQNILKEKELNRIKDKERERKIQKEKLKHIFNSISKEDSKEQLQFNEISEIKREKDEELEKRNDKNQIWWSKLENYNIEDLGLNEEEKDLFIKSELISDDNKNNNQNSINQNNNDNNSIGALVLENSLLKSNSKSDAENNVNNNSIKDQKAEKIQLPKINSTKNNNKKETEKRNKKKPGEFFKTSQNHKIKLNKIDNIKI